MNRLLHRLLYRLLPLRAYLLTVSRLYFLTLALGCGRHTRALEYAYHLPRLLRPGDTAIDIGANLGYYTRPMSRIVGPEGRVYAVEPVPVICEVLRRNLRGRDNVRILNCALGDGDRPVEMANDSVAAAGYFGTGRNFVDDGRNARGDAIRFKAQMRRGSSLFADVDRIDFIKCDIGLRVCRSGGDDAPRAAPPPHDPRRERRRQPPEPYRAVRQRGIRTLHPRRRRPRTPPRHGRR